MADGRMARVCDVRDIRRDGICNPVAYVLCIGADFKRFGDKLRSGPGYGAYMCATFGATEFAIPPLTFRALARLSNVSVRVPDRRCISTTPAPNVLCLTTAAKRAGVWEMCATGFETPSLTFCASARTSNVSVGVARPAMHQPGKIGHIFRARQFHPGLDNHIGLFYGPGCELLGNDGAVAQPTKPGRSGASSCPTIR